jgi:hypothetical protein
MAAKTSHFDHRLLKILMKQNRPSPANVREHEVNGSCAMSTKEPQFHPGASSFGPPHIDLLNSLNVARAFSLCFAHSSSLISGGGSWGGG